MAIVNVGIIGSGVVGQALARGFARLGQGVKIGSRTPEKLSDFIEQNDGVTSGTFEETARFGDLIGLATLGVAPEEAGRIAGQKNFDGKGVIDATNPLDFGGGMPPKLVVSHTDSPRGRGPRGTP